MTKEEGGKAVRKMRRRIARTLIYAIDGTVKRLIPLRRRLTRTIGYVDPFWPGEPPPLPRGIEATGATLPPKFT